LPQNGEMAHWCKRMAGMNRPMMHPAAP